jgi:glycosyltransferase involved in cell wall biosynthesis
LFNNDPELAAWVAQALPRYVVWHLAHNTNRTHPRWAARFAERVRPLAVSDFVARWWDEHLGLPQGTTRTLHAGVDADLFAPGPKPERPTVTYVGLLNERKGPDVLLAACEALVDVPPYSLRVVGDVHYGAHELDAFSRRLHEAADRLRQRGVDVELTGFVPRTEVARLLASSSIHVVPSRWDEPFSLAALEGMASGAATIVTDRGGLPEAAGGAGLVVPADDPPALADALQRLLTDEDERHCLAKRGREHALEMTWTRTWHGLSGLEPSLHGS